MDLIVLCCGSRFWNDKRKIEKEMDKLEKRYHRISLVIEGGADGADKLCRVEAERRGIQTCTFHANWFFYKKSAGPIRNANQLEFAIRISLGHNKLIVLAFHPNIQKSLGTASMVGQARKACVEVKLVA